MSLSTLYPDLVVVGGRGPDGVVLVLDVLVREQADLAWVRVVCDGPTDDYDHQRRRTGQLTHGWSRVWPVPTQEWDRRNQQVLGIWAPELAEGQDDKS